MKKYTTVLASIFFSLIIAAILTALITDGVIIGEHLIGFATALMVSAMTFIFGIILMVLSVMFIFGIIVLQNNGFWPMEWARTTFKEVMKDYPVSQSQIQTLLIIRVVLLVICLIVLIMSIIVSAQVGKARKENPEVKVKPARGFAIASRVLSIIGIVVCTGMLVILATVVK